MSIHCRWQPSRKRLGSDIAIILDRPTGMGVTRNFASKTVSETLAAADQTLPSLKRNDMIWTLPIQGGKYPGSCLEEREKIR